MKITKKILSMILAVVMVLGLLPATAFATGAAEDVIYLSVSLDSGYIDDKNGEPIAYTVVETWETDDWIPNYGPVTATDGSIPTYETVVTNVYRWTGSFELPGTGGIGYPIYILGGLILIMAPLVYGLSLRRRCRKGERE